MPKPALRKVVIFDFNRTIYDPERRLLAPRVFAILRTLQRRGFRLYLVSTANPSRRLLIQELKLKEHFKKIFLVENKRIAFETILASKKVDRAGSFVVGDRVRGEIRIANALGLQTIWLRAGKFANERPRLKGERPTYVIQKLGDITKLIHLEKPYSLT